MWCRNRKRHSVTPSRHARRMSPGRVSFFSIGEGRAVPWMLARTPCIWLLVELIDWLINPTNSFRYIPCDFGVFVLLLHACCKRSARSAARSAESRVSTRKPTKTKPILASDCLFWNCLWGPEPNRSYQNGSSIGFQSIDCSAIAEGCSPGVQRRSGNIGCTGSFCLRQAH
jgi:hypothetical protein